MHILLFILKGKGLFAKRSFRKGDTIFTERPLVSAQFLWNSLYKYKGMMLMNEQKVLGHIFLICSHMVMLLTVRIPSTDCISYPKYSLELRHAFGSQVKFTPAPFCFQPANTAYMLWRLQKKMRGGSAASLDSAFRTLSSAVSDQSCTKPARSVRSAQICGAETKMSF